MFARRRLTSRMVGMFALIFGHIGAVIALLHLIFIGSASTSGDKIYAAAAFIAIIMHVFLTGEGYMLLRGQESGFLSYFLGFETAYFLSFVFVVPTLVSRGYIAELDVHRVVAVSSGFGVQMACLFPLWGWLALRRDWKSRSQTLSREDQSSN